MGNRDDSLMRNLGKFVGGIWHGVKTPAQTPPARVRTSVEERETEHDGRRVILRRTIIEEIEAPRGLGRRTEK